MKYYLTVFLIFMLFTGCDKPGDCIKSVGPMAVKDYDNLSFDKIVVNRGISLVITQGNNYHVRVQTGENLINDIVVKVVDNVLILEDATVCNWVRDFGQTTVFVTAPNLNKIFSKTELPILSQGILTYPNLHLVSMDTEDGYAGAGTGDFYLQINNNGLLVENNNVSRFYISGHTQQLSVNFYEAGGIFYGQELHAETVNFYHRGSNDLYINPTQSITGDIYNIGNVIALTRPSTVNVTEHYQGRMIFY